MPFKKSYKPKSTKKVYKSKYVRKPNPTKNLSMVTLGKGFPKKCVFTHKYFDTFTMTTTGGATSSYNFSCNGMYDPNVTAAGHQPMYFDQAGAIWDHYTVIGSKITLKIANRSATNTNGIVSIYLNDDTAITPTLTAIVETTSAKYANINAANLDQRTLVNSWSAKKMFGSNPVSNNSLQGTTTANPTEQTHYQILVYPVDLGSSNVYDCSVLIEYIAVWAELRDIGGS